MKYLIAVSVGLIYSLTAVATVQAAPITCAGADCSFSLGDAASCAQGVDANPKPELISALGGLWTGSWSHEGGLLSVDVLAGSHRAGNLSGTWAIDPGFWSTWGRGVISVHVGQGGGGPDWWVFLVEPGDVGGTWSYAMTSGNGGGLASIKLWGSDRLPGSLENATADQQLISNPEPASLMLLGTGLAGLAFAVRRRRRTA